MVNVLSCWNSLKTKVDNLDVDKLKTDPKYVKKLNNAVSKKVAKNKKIQQTKYNSK